MINTRGAGKKRLLIIAVLAVMAVAIGLFAMQALRGGGDNDRHQGGSEVLTSLQLNPPQGWKTQPVTEGDLAAGVIWKLRSTSPEASATLRTVVSDLADSFNIDQLPDQLEQSFKAEIDDFKLVSKGLSESGPYRFAQIRYKGRVEDEKGVYENLMVVIPLEKQAFYFSFRAPEADFSKIESAIAQMVDHLNSHIESRSAED